ncbi:MAG: 2-C-methyl-D-erythritol 4-phosphate cytidylyltransferase [Clostridia bacterium]|nr:2-C-methyl-D-erythritol 4-phosphate cytidylyltransferase [Clostridia bacterium]
MIKPKLELKYTVCQSEEKVPVIVVAAGSSLRMKGVNKQLYEIGGIPVIVRTLLAFENCDAISNIVLVVKTEDLFKIQFICEKYKLSKLTDIVCGGDSRQESVIKGFERIPQGAEKVLIHDGARPLVSDSVIKAVIDGLSKFSACCCAVKVKDTIKEVAEDLSIIKTIPRDNLVAVQTPQGVKVKEYLEAVKDTDVSLFTDDVSIMEAKGYSAGVVDGDYKNIKITTTEDLILAESFLENYND